MSISHSTRLLTLALIGYAGISGVGCSSPEKSPPRESAASEPSTTRTADTATTSRAPETSAARPTPVKASSVSTPKPRSTAPRASTTQKPSATLAADTTDSSADSAGASATPAAEPAQDKWLSYDVGTKTVTFQLIAGPFTFNGFRNGGGTLVLPPNANVVINFVNKDGTPHSAIVISGEGPIPNSATDPAIQRAYTNKVLEGLPQEGTDVMRFPAPASGTYRIFCGVPGHGLSGMWIWMKIDPAAKTPTFGPTKA